MIVLIAGRTASGKSTLAQRAAACCDGRHASFGGYIRSLASRDGLDADDRLTLQDLGQSLVDKDVDAFVHDFLVHFEQSAGRLLIADGLRHQSVLEAVRRAADRIGDRVVLCFVEVGDDVRVQRLGRRGLDQAQAAAIEQHQSEQDVLSHLRAQADLVIDGAQPEADMVNKLVAFLGSSG